jgi:hypothetical protein
MITTILMINPLQQEQDIRKRAAKEREIPVRKMACALPESFSIGDKNGT